MEIPLRLRSLGGRTMAFLPQTFLDRAITGVFLIALGIGAADASNPELLIVEDPDCGPCKLFERQVGSLYPRTEVSRRLPMRRVQLGAHLDAGVRFIHPIVRAPTFVIVEDRVEQHRFEGYASDELFWMTLERLVPE